MTMLCVMNFSREMLRGIEILIDRVFFFFLKSSIWEKFPQGTPLLPVWQRLKMQRFQDQRLFTMWGTIPRQSGCKKEVSFNLFPFVLLLFFFFHFLLLTNLPLISLISGLRATSSFILRMDINTKPWGFLFQDFVVFLFVCCFLGAFLWLLRCSKRRDRYLKW